MKLFWPALAAGLLLFPLAANAQGYSGVMAPQEGYHPPPGTSTPAPPPAVSGSDFGSPYSGTGATGATGYTSMMSGSDGDAGADGAPLPDDDAFADDDKPVHMASPFMNSFAPKAKDDDGNQGSASIYDAVDNSTGTATERRRKAVIRKIEADQRKQQEDIKRMNAAHEREVHAFIQKTVAEQRHKMHPEEDDDDADQDNSTQDQGADDTSPDAVKQ